MTQLMDDLFWRKFIKWITGLWTFIIFCLFILSASVLFWNIMLTKVVLATCLGGSFLFLLIVWFRMGKRLTEHIKEHKEEKGDE